METGNLGLNNFGKTAFIDDKRDKTGGHGFDHSNTKMLGFLGFFDLVNAEPGGMPVDFGYGVKLFQLIEIGINKNFYR